jgi:hypothetical protein
MANKKLHTILFGRAVPGEKDHMARRSPLSAVEQYFLGTRYNPADYEEILGQVRSCLRTYTTLRDSKQKPGGITTTRIVLTGILPFMSSGTCYGVTVMVMLTETFPNAPPVIRVQLDQIPIPPAMCGINQGGIVDVATLVPWEPRQTTLVDCLRALADFLPSCFFLSGRLRPMPELESKVPPPPIEPEILAAAQKEIDANMAVCDAAVQRRREHDALRSSVDLVGAMIQYWESRVAAQQQSIGAVQQQPDAQCVVPPAMEAEARFQAATNAWRQTLDELRDLFARGQIPTDDFFRLVRSQAAAHFTNDVKPLM